MTLLDWVAVAVIVGGLVYLRRRIVALVRDASAAVAKRPPLRLALGILLSLIAAVLIAWKVPIWELASRQALLTPDKYLELQNSYRATIVQALAGLALLFTIYLTWRRVEVAQEGQITERFTRAIEQLGKKDQLEVRLGGIYALERIARDSERDHWPIMEVLTAYVRERSPAHEKAGDGNDKDSEPATTDIRAIVTVLGRRRVEFERLGGQELDLGWTNLSEANLSGACLAGANLLRASLFFANLSGANLSGACLIGADLSEASLTGADLVGANLIGAELSGADLSRASLYGADLSSLDLSKARGLTREQIESAITDENTILPDYLKEGGEEPAEEAGGEGES